MIMSTTIMQASTATFDPSATGSLFSCSRSEIPCHHFCLHHSKPLNQEVEEWFMTDEVEEEPAVDERKQEGEDLEEEEEEEDSDMMEAGLLDQLLDEAYSQYYDEPDEWEELAQWYTARINCDEPWEGGEQEEEEAEEESTGAASSGAAHQDFHPAWRQEPAGTSGASAASTSHGEQRRPGELQPAGSSQARGTSKRRDWAEMADQQDREEEMELSAAQQHRNSATRVRECELYDAFNDLFFPDPESGRL